MADRLKFIKDVEVRARGLSGDSVRRSFDALDELRTENARLRRELIEAREENRQLRDQLDRVPVTAPTVAVPAIAKESPEQKKDEKDDAEVRFSLLELK